MEYIIQTRRLSKVFQGKTLIDSVDLHVKKGEIYGFMGANGAGKTTLMKMIANLIKPTSGEIEVFNETLFPDSYQYLRRIGSIIEVPRFIEDLTGRQNLELHCEYMGFYQKGSIDETLKLVKMSDQAEKKVKQYSLGMKQRLGIARAIITKPELLLLDEPINGLDPSGIKEIRELLLMLSRQYGISILISSHILSELELLADTIGIIDHGKMIQELSIAEVRAKNTVCYELESNDIQLAVTVLSEKLGLQNFKVIDERFLRIYEQDVPKAQIIRALSESNVDIESFQVRESSLEDYFLKQTEEDEIHA